MKEDKKLKDGEKEEMKKKLIDKIIDNYIETEELVLLMNDYYGKTELLYESILKSEIQLTDRLILEIALWWTAEDFSETEKYRNYVSKMLIKPELIYHLRNYYCLLFDDHFSDK